MLYGIVFLILPRDAMLARYMLLSCVRLFVCPSDTRRFCTKTAKYHASNDVLAWTLPMSGKRC